MCSTFRHAPDIIKLMIRIWSKVPVELTFHPYTKSERKKHTHISAQSSAHSHKILQAFCWFFNWNIIHCLARKRARELSNENAQLCHLEALAIESFFLRSMVFRHILVYGFRFTFFSIPWIWLSLYSDN